MKVLVDSSIWIEYFRSGEASEVLEELIDSELVVTNEVILSELLPCLWAGKHRELSALLESVEQLPLGIDWQDIRNLARACIAKGINKVGIPDLLIAQNSVQHRVLLQTADKHFHLMRQKRVAPLDLL